MLMKKYILKCFEVRDILFVVDFPETELQILCMSQLLLIKVRLVSY